MRPLGTLGKQDTEREKSNLLSDSSESTAVIFCVREELSGKHIQQITSYLQQQRQCMINTRGMRSVNPCAFLYLGSTLTAQHSIHSQPSVTVILPFPPHGGWYGMAQELKKENRGKIFMDRNTVSWLLFAWAVESKGTGLGNCLENSWIISPNIRSIPFHTLLSWDLFTSSSFSSLLII